MILSRGKASPKMTYDGTGRQLPLFRRTQQIGANAKFYVICFECCEMVEVYRPSDGEWWIPNHRCDGIVRTVEL